MALFEHGLRRFTEDVDILVTGEGLKNIHAKLVGLGYVEPFAGSKHLRDTELGVRIEFLVTGQFPGDGKPKPIAFPDPIQVCFKSNGNWTTKSTIFAQSMDELINKMPEAKETLLAMRADGVSLDPSRSSDEAARLFTTDPEVAKKYDMHDESEFMES